VYICFSVNPGPNFRAKNDNNTWELWSSTSELDSPGIFRAAYLKRFGAAAANIDAGNVLPLLSMASLLIPLKLMETAGTDDAEQMRLAALRLSTPSIAGKFQFDTLGRLVDYDMPINQIGKFGEYNLITPLAVGVEGIYPMPTWSERIFAPEFFSTTAEQAVIAVNSVALVYVCCLLLGILISAKVTNYNILATIVFKYSFMECFFLCFLFL
jgi:hypothetical protein